MKNVKLFSLLLCIIMAWGCQKKNYQKMEGGIYGTVYHVSYQSSENLNKEVVREMERVNASLSMFNKNSVISKINRSESDSVDSLFVRMFEMALQVNRESEGAFDITVAPLSNAWGFGFKNEAFPSAGKIDSLLQYVGMEKLVLADGKLRKAAEGVEMDASSIAKGLGVDLVADYFDQKGIENYMVEIGGEVRVKGQNDKGRDWRVGVDKPIDNATMQDRALEFVVCLSEGALATSGNYRNFYIHEGKKYGHTINPKTGYPVQRDILSSSVYAKTCMEADAYATAFMVLGMEKAKQMLENNSDLEACFIYEEGDSQKIWMSEGFKKMVLTE